MAATDNLHPKWLNAARRMQAFAVQQRGYAIVTIKVLVGPDGGPVHFCEPSLCKLEPNSDASRFLEGLINGMAP